ncbi:MAG: glycosyltransferase, partial [Clostridiales bacterium]|nr:glycosyltransferase [Clostridiales bacterium]
QPDETLNAINDSPYSDRIVRTGYVSNEEKRDLLRNASCFVFPSIYEGFGMPVTEAMACGTDAIVSDSSSLSEIAGTLITKIEPKDAELFAQAMEEKLLNAPGEERRKELRDSACSYTWDQAAKAARAAIDFASSSSK